MIKSLLASLVLAGVQVPGNVPTQQDYAVESAARLYRIQVYNTFRQNRAEYDRRQAAGRRALEEWKELGRNNQQGDELIRWFAEAESASSLDRLRSLPQWPGFMQRGDRLVAGRDGDSATTPVTHNAADKAHAADHGQFDNVKASSIDKQPGAAADSDRDPFVFKSPEGTNPPTASMRPQNVDFAPGAKLSDNTADSGAVRGFGRAVLKAFAATDSPASTAAGRPASTLAEVAVTPKVHDDQFDTVELKARVEGYNLAVSSVNDILSDDGPISSDELTLLVEELEDLVQRYRDLQPFLGLNQISEADRKFLGKLISPRNSIDRLTQRIQKVHAELQEAQGNAASGDHIDELLELKLLTRRLEDLTIDP